MEVIHGGTITHINGVEQPFSIRKLVPKDLKDVLSVQRRVVAELADKTILQPLNEEEFQYILEGNGLMIGAFVEEKLIAFRALLVPEIDDEHLGRDIGLAEEDLGNVIYQEVSNVLKEYRGNKLQRTLAILIMQELTKLESQFQYVCCTVAPFNIPSLKDKFVQGMEIAALKEKYGGVLRYVFVKDLSMPEMRTWEEVITIPMDDIATQQTKLAQGWHGFQIEQENNNWNIYYGK